jgi:hypothetical protein
MRPFVRQLVVLACIQALGAVAAVFIDRRLTRLARKVLGFEQLHSLGWRENADVSGSWRLQVDRLDPPSEQLLWIVRLSHKPGDSIRNAPPKESVSDVEFASFDAHMASRSARTAAHFVL